MSNRKKYISTGASPLSVDILTDNGMLKSFDFKGGAKHPVVRMPQLTLTDKDDQKLLESHTSFNKSFILDQKFVTEKQATTPGENKIIPEEEEVEITEKIFAKVLDAKTWLNDEKKVSFSKLKNKANVISEALALGYNLSFETDNK